MTLKPATTPRTDTLPVITLSCHASDYSASRIARAVEDCDCHLLGLDARPSDGRDGYYTVTVITSDGRLPSVVASLERYGYEVTDVAKPSVVARTGSPEAFSAEDDPLAGRVAQVLRYLEI